MWAGMKVWQTLGAEDRNLHTNLQASQELYQDPTKKNGETWEKAMPLDGGGKKQPHWKLSKLITTMNEQFSLVVQLVKHLPAMLETHIQSLGQEDSLEKEVATHSRIHAWEIPWTEESGEL